jgi:hypothetical protein
MAKFFVKQVPKTRINTESSLQRFLIPALEQLKKPTFAHYLAETIAIRLLPLCTEAIHA